MATLHWSYACLHPLPCLYPTSSSHLSCHLPAISSPSAIAICIVINTSPVSLHPPTTILLSSCLLRLSHPSCLIPILAAYPSTTQLLPLPSVAIPLSWPDPSRCPLLTLHHAFWWPPSLPHPHHLHSCSSHFPISLMLLYSLFRHCPPMAAHHLVSPDSALHSSDILPSPSLLCHPIPYVFTLPSISC